MRDSKESSKTQQRSVPDEKMIPKTADKALEAERAMDVAGPRIKKGCPLILGL